MNIFRVIMAACYTLLLSTAILCISAQQVQADSYWTTDKGDCSVEITEDGMHVAQYSGTHTTHYALATRHLIFSADKPWKVSFDFKFGQLRSAGCGVTISQGTSPICWVGGDQWYKSMVSGVGQTLVYQQPVDDQWHNFTFQSDTKTITIILDGKAVGSGSSVGNPDFIKIGSFVDKQPIPGEQTEVWVRGFQMTSGAAGNHQIATNPTVPSPVGTASSVHLQARTGTSSSKKGKVNLDSVHRQFATKDATIALLRQKLASLRGHAGVRNHKYHSTDNQEIVQNQTGHELETSATVAITAQIQVTPQTQTSVTAPTQLADLVHQYNYLLSRTQALMHDEDIAQAKCEQCLDWLDANEYADPNLRVAVLVATDKVLSRSKADDSSIQSNLSEALTLWQSIHLDASFATYYTMGDLCTSCEYIHLYLYAQGAQNLRFIINH